MSAPSFTVPLGVGEATVSAVVREGDTLHATIRYRSRDLMLTPRRFNLSAPAERELLCAWVAAPMREVTAFLAAVEAHLARPPLRAPAVDRALARLAEELASAVAPPAAPWEPLTPLDARASLPAFPTSVLPPALAGMVAGVATATQTPPDLAGLLALAAVAAAVGKTTTVCVRDGWVEPLAFWALIALPSGHRKSVVFRELTAPLLAWERTRAAALRPAIARAASERRTLEAALSRAETEAARPRSAAQADLVAARDAAAEALARHTTPVVPLLSVGDVTPEALAQALGEQGGALAVLSPEGGLFDTLAGRYSNGVPNLDIFLHGYSGEDYRRTRGRETEYVREVTLTLALTVQPDVLSGLAGQPGFRGRGLLARFWYAVPPSSVGQRCADPPPAPAAARETYAAALTGLLALRPPVDAQAPAPQTLTLAPDALAHLVAWGAEIESMLDEFEPLGAIADWGLKLAGGTARVAALLHLAYHGAAGLSRPISERTVARAIDLARWAIPHAQAAHGAMGADTRLEPARYLLRALARLVERKAVSTFTRRELHNLTRARFPNPRDLEAPLALLVEYGYVRLATVPRGVGRPSVVYEVNPAVGAP
jgi:replicative DNA helicase